METEPSGLLGYKPDQNCQLWETKWPLSGGKEFVLARLKFEFTWLSDFLILSDGFLPFWISSFSSSIKVVAEITWATFSFSFLPFLIKWSWLSSLAASRDRFRFRFVSFDGPFVGCFVSLVFVSSLGLISSYLAARTAFGGRAGACDWRARKEESGGSEGGVRRRRRRRRRPSQRPKERKSRATTDDGRRERGEHAHDTTEGTRIRWWELDTWLTSSQDCIDQNFGW